MPLATKLSAATAYLQQEAKAHSTVIATHSGQSHLDDIFGVAVLQVLLPRSHVIRTRNADAVAAANFTVDVGGVSAPATGRFDHHQASFKGKRKDGTGYASAGLVWATHGAACVQALTGYLDEKSAQAVADALDESLVAHIDRADTGAAAGAPGLFGMTMLMSQLNPTWTEMAGQSAAWNEQLQKARFMEAVQLVRTLLTHAVRTEAATLRAAHGVRMAEKLMDDKVMVLRTPGTPWQRVVCEEMPDVLLVVFPDSAGGYLVQTVPCAPESMVSRVELPAEWAGLRDKAFAKACGVPDATFCHKAKFIGGAASLDGALELARVALLNMAVPAA